MPIKPSFTGISESIAGFEAAALQKIESGFTLMTSGSHGDGVYLMGYAAEMLLKSAFLRLEGYSFNQPITQIILKTLKQNMVTNFHVTPPTEGLHDLIFWGEAIIAKRANNGIADAMLNSELTACVQALSENWWVSMRYQDTGPADHKDLAAVFDNVLWIQANHQRLWS